MLKPRCLFAFPIGRGTDGCLELRMLEKLCELTEKGLANSPQFFKSLTIAFAESPGSVIPGPPPE